MPLTIQRPCQSRKTGKNELGEVRLVLFANQDLADSANDQLGTFATRGASTPRDFNEEY
jgi:hypothetical protein